MDGESVSSFLSRSVGCHSNFARGPLFLQRRQKQKLVIVFVVQLAHDIVYRPAFPFLPNGRFGVRYAAPREKRSVHPGSSMRLEQSALARTTQAPD